MGITLHSADHLFDDDQYFGVERTTVCLSAASDCFSKVRRQTKLECV
jgi:hypothetical protein